MMDGARGQTRSLSDFDHNAFDSEGNLKTTSLHTGQSVENIANLFEPIREGREGAFSSRQIWTVVTLSLVTFIDAVAYSLLAPFYPQEATSKGVNDTTIGFIFGIFEFAFFISSPFFGAYITQIGCRFMLIAGIFTCGTTAILFGFLDKSPVGWVYILMSFLVRIVEAIGASAQITASFAIVANTFPERVATMFGVIETFNGLGLMAGPVFGGLFYQIGGFKLPFMVIGGILFSCGFLISIILPSQNDVPKTKSSSLMRLASQSTVIVLSILLTMAASTIGFFQPTLAKHLDQFHLSTVLIGVIFVVAPALYAASSPFWGWASDKWGLRRPLFVTGTFGVGIGFILLGPWPVLMSPPQLWIVIISLLLLGLSIGATFVPTTNECIHVARTLGYPDDFETYGLVSGIINACISLGGFVGPIGGGALVEQMGFEMASTCVGLFIICTAILASVFYLCKRRNAGLSFPVIESESLKITPPSEPNARTRLLT